MNNIAKKSNLSKIKSKLALESILKMITEFLKVGNTVEFIGFGIFKVNNCKERADRNSQTGMRIKNYSSKYTRIYS
ncbi:HU family DNA-binding protein [Candidatus Profftia tarda]|uniref:HU family DNA-binding protein n=1 Tax=Candidatus Profftia tarda TaxID=1177216 RepID=UPI003B968D87